MRAPDTVLNPARPYTRAVKHLLLMAPIVLTLAACAPARALDPFVERRPDPVKDQGAHNAPIEWWYVNGHLDTPSGPKGFAAAIFQVLLPPNLKVSGLSAQSLIPGPLFFGHYSVVDKTTGRFEIGERSSLPNAAPQIAGTGSAATERMDVKLSDWRMSRGANGAYQMRLSITQDGQPLDIALAPERPEVVHGPGWSGSPETGRMYYYSATRLRVTGRLGDQPVTGIAWVDHQWGGGDGDGSSSITPRWDWFSLQLDDGRDMMVYRVKNAKGQVADEYVSITSGGEATSSRVFKLRPLSTWKSGTDAEYPVVWVLTLENGERFDISAVTNNQEVRSEATAGFAYYEGAVKVTGASTGVGYMELTGYAPVVSNPFAALGQR